MGLHPNSPLRSSLTRRPPKIVWALMKKVEEYCKVEDDALRVKAGRKVDKSTPSGPVQPVSVVPSRSPEPRTWAKQDKMRDSRCSSNQCSHRSNEKYQVDNRRTRRSDNKYTKLAELIDKILSKVQHHLFFKWSSKMMWPFDTMRRDKRCEYHKDHGHDTDNCYALKDQLEELVQDSRLAQYVRKNNPSNTVALQPNSPPLGIIHMIYSLPLSVEVHTVQSQPSVPKPITPTKRPYETRRISFDDIDLAGVTLPHTDPLVVELRMNKFTVQRILIDQRSTSEIMYYKTFVKLDFTDSDLLPADYPLFDFNANPEYPLGKITLLVQASARSVDVEFLVVKLPSPYNLIMGITWLHTMQAMPSTYHQLLRFPTEYGIEKIRGSQKSAQACYLIVVTKEPKELEVNSVEVSDRESLEDIGKIPSEKAIEDLDRIEINGSLDKFFMIGTSLSKVDRRELVSFLFNNLDVFPWTLYEMPGVDPVVAQYRLNVDPKVKPIIQKS
ncbi:uncharacterized protein LOC114258601 [Camellia sinensis]|uniref:uncharacterized protein LOC114258601 n=1 Tax=Camellia sinensis TaxID=4442 RepID=UPI001036B6D8|nr:uncharacterized protein LOC114258601 [Camellia sinensis]